MEELVFHQMTIGGIYYSDFNCDPKILEVCLDNLKKVFPHKIVSVTLNKPLDLGTNIVMQGERSNTMYNRQILTALESLDTDIVFYLEHDVLYSKEHFDFIPRDDKVFYYDLAIFRWEYPNDKVISYDGLTSLSMMCCYRQWALEHYRKRLERILKSGWDKEDGIGKMQPVWMRQIGYEPGTKRRRIGGFSNDVSERWISPNPTVDIRHGKTLSNPKTNLHQFKHPPLGWREEKLSHIKNFNLKELFKL